MAKKEEKRPEENLPEAEETAAGLPAEETEPAPVSEENEP